MPSSDFDEDHKNDSESDDGSMDMDTTDDPDHDCAEFRGNSLLVTTSKANTAIALHLSQACHIILDKESEDEESAEDILAMANRSGLDSGNPVQITTHLDVLSDTLQLELPDLNPHVSADVRVN